MAVSFHHHIEVLLRDFQRRGLEPEIVQVSGNPPRAMEIRVAKKISVHWDADSRSVWAEGPWPEIERLESYIRRRFSGRWRWLKRIQGPKRVAGFVFAGLVAAVLIGVCIPAIRSQLSSVPSESGEKKLTSQEPANVAIGINADAKPMETAGVP